MNARHHIQAFLTRRRVARVVQVHEHNIELARFDQSHDSRWGIDGFNLIALTFHQKPQRFHNVGLIIGDKNTRRCGFHKRQSEPRIAIRGSELYLFMADSFAILFLWSELRRKEIPDEETAQVCWQSYRSRKQ